MKKFKQIMFMILLLIGSLGISGCGDAKEAAKIDITNITYVPVGTTNKSNNLIKFSNSSSEENSSSVISSDNNSESNSSSEASAAIDITSIYPKYFTNKDFFQSSLDPVSDDMGHLSISFEYPKDVELESFVLFNTSLDYDTFSADYDNPKFDIFYYDITQFECNDEKKFVDYRYTFNSDVFKGKYAGDSEKYNFDTPTKNKVNLFLTMNSQFLDFLNFSSIFYITDIFYHEKSSGTIDQKIYNIDPSIKNFNTDVHYYNNEELYRNSKLYLINYFSFLGDGLTTIVHSASLLIFTFNLSRIDTNDNWNLFLKQYPADQLHGSILPVYDLDELLYSTDDINYQPLSSETNKFTKVEFSSTSKDVRFSILLPEALIDSKYIYLKYHGDFNFVFNTVNNGKVEKTIKTKSEITEDIKDLYLNPSEEILNKLDNDLTFKLIVIK